MLVWLPGGDLVAPGDVLNVGWSASLVDTIEPGFGGYVTAQGAAATGYVWWMTVEERGSSWLRLLVKLRDRISDGLARVLPGDAGALAAGIVTGDDSRLSESAKDAFLYTGTSHITAVSGSNVAMVLAIWNLVIPAGRNRRLLAVQLVVIVSIWIYTLLVGLEPPALRAAIMASLMLLGSRFGRRPDLMTLLALTSAALVLWNPNHVHMVGFWLSVVATAALIMRVPETPGVGWKASIRGMLEGILLAQVATLPIILVTFGTLSLTSPVANALLTPIMWLAFPFCFTLAAVVLLVPFVAPAVAVIPLIPLSLALQVVDHLSAAAPRLNVQNAGFAGLVAVVLPCLVIAAVLSRDARRWAAIVAIRWREQPGLVASAVIGPSIGVMIALLVAVAIE
jgi:competence protein ComEC